MGSLKSSPSPQFAGESDLEMSKKGEVEGDEEMIMENNNNNKDVEEGDDVVISIEKMIMELPSVNPNSSLYKVPKGHIKTNETMYTPRFISIGPFHHGQPELMAAEQYKLWALKTYLCRAKMGVKEAMSLACSWEEKARSCYGHPIDMNKQNFAKMMLLDGCFILEFLNITNDLYIEDDEKWIDDGSLIYRILYDVERDLTIYENQLPFFVLQQLYDLLPFPPENDDPAVHFMECMSKLFIATTTGYSYHYNATTEVRHLVDLLKFYFIPSPDTDEYKKFKESEEESYLESPNLTKLCEAGVKVQKADEAKSMMDFSFKNGILKIPPTIIHNVFEIHIRNLIVSEIVSEDETYLFHYVALLDDLIDTEKDVSILVKEKIISNTSGCSDQQVAELINNLRLNAPTFPDKCYYYNHMSKELNDYCNKWWHRSMASLRRDYFNTPWASISFFAATFLLILTFLQTLFSTPFIFYNK
ncbi:UPF0481 protein At3g47200-like [Benincasa hispida]|uniref:UPF0481 protein At3g47200-like n=1 Tax=Benincasa hispida TaxID=102211 RepID=UPI001900D311|nr:UPF0481 protein At3g47200-like [Benincasa hispida]